MTKLFTSNRMTPLIIALSFFMESVDSTVINTAIPAMARTLSVDPVDLKVALISYLVSLAIFIPISGWLSDKYGPKKVFMISLFVFTLGSLWCGFSKDLTELIIARFFQGMGGALGLPVGRLIIVKTFGRENLIIMMSRVITVSAIGMMLGPVIGGYITHYFSWHWIFWVNVPVGIFACIMAKYWLKHIEPSPVHPLDKVGFILFASGLALFTFGLSALSESTGNTRLSLGALLLSIGLLASYMMHSYHRGHPIVKTDLLALRTFRVSVVGNLISRLGFGGVPFLVPLLLQIEFGYTSELSGLLMAPTALGVLLAKPLALPLLRYGGYRNVLIANTICMALSLWVFILVDASTSFVMIGILMFSFGFIMALQYSFMNSLAYADIHTNDYSAANSIVSTLQQIAMSFGVAMSAVCIRLFSFIHSGKLLLTIPVFHQTFFSIGLITLLSIPIFMRLEPNDGQQMIV
jgi:EmrB/QacA subfamily drug resistance transporter